MGSQWHAGPVGSLGRVMDMSMRTDLLAAAWLGAFGQGLCQAGVAAVTWVP